MPIGKRESVVINELPSSAVDRPEVLFLFYWTSQPIDGGAKGRSGRSQCRQGSYAQRYRSSLLQRSSLVFQQPRIKLFVARCVWPPHLISSHLISSHLHTSVSVSFHFHSSLFSDFAPPPHSFQTKDGPPNRWMAELFGPEPHSPMLLCAETTISLLHHTHAKKKNIKSLFNPFSRPLYSMDSFYRFLSIMHEDASLILLRRFYLARWPWQYSEDPLIHS